MTNGIGGPDGGHGSGRPAGRKPTGPGRPGPKTERGGRGGQAKRQSGARAPSRRVETEKRVAPPMASNARRVALNILNAVDEGAFANLILPQLLARARREGMEERDAALVTELVYGTIRMRRELDAVLAPHMARTPDAGIRTVLRLGAYQIRHLRVPAHAAVSETVDIAPLRGRGFVNAVLRQVAAAKSAPQFASDAERLSYPDWIVNALVAGFGHGDAIDVLEAMNVAAVVHLRSDGYVQDPASQAVAAFAGAEPGERVLDLGAAPGGKTTAMAGLGAFVVAGELHAHRIGLIAENVKNLKLAEQVAMVQCDARHLPVRPGSFDRVLVDAPCSGLGSLRRRPDARWRIQETDVADLVKLQKEFVRSAVSALRPGGVLIFSVCTLTTDETVGIDEWIANEFPNLLPIDRPSGEGWREWGRGALVLPGVTDGMFAVAYRKAE